MASTTNAIAQILVIRASFASMPLDLFLPKKVSAAPLTAPRPARSLLCSRTVTIITRQAMISRMPINTLIGGSLLGESRHIILALFL